MLASIVDSGLTLNPPFKKNWLKIALKLLFNSHSTFSRAVARTPVYYVRRVKKALK